MPSARADVFFVLRNLNGGTFPSSKESVLAVLKEAYASGRYKMPMCFEARSAQYGKCLHVMMSSASTLSAVLKSPVAS